MKTQNLHRTKEVAARCHVDEKTLRRWVKAKAFSPVPEKDPLGWFIWTDKHVKAAKGFAESRVIAARNQRARLTSKQVQP